MLFAYFALSICIDQVSRFVSDPFVFTMETNYNDWPFNVPGYTICTDYVNRTFIDQLYKRSENVTLIDYKSESYRDYYNYTEKIGSLNAENIHFVEEFEKTELFKGLSGEEIFDIALNV